MRRRRHGSPGGCEDDTASPGSPRDGGDPAGSGAVEDGTGESGVAGDRRLREAGSGGCEDDTGESAVTGDGGVRSRQRRVQDDTGESGVTGDGGSEPAAAGARTTQASPGSPGTAAPGGSGGNGLSDPAAAAPTNLDSGVGRVESEPCLRRPGAAGHNTPGGRTGNNRLGILAGKLLVVYCVPNAVTREAGHRVIGEVATSILGETNGRLRESVRHGTHRIGDSLYRSS